MRIFTKIRYLQIPKKKLDTLLCVDSFWNFCCRLSERVASFLENEEKVHEE